MDSIAGYLSGLVLLGVDGLVTYGFYKLYENLYTEADAIEGLPLYKVGPELYSYVNNLPTKCLPYVGICGLSKMSKDAHLQTSNFPSVGLIHEASTIKHIAEIVDGVRKDVTKTISDVVRSCKFGICAPDSFTSENDPSFVDVKLPLRADYLLSYLPIIKNEFKPNKFNIKDLDVKNGEVITGYQYTEAALKEGVKIFGVGKLYMTSDKSQLCFGPPDLIDGRYILTTLTKSQVVGNLRIKALFSGIVYSIFLCTGTALALWLLYNFFSDLWTFARSLVDSRENVEIGINPSLSMSAQSNQINDDASACNVCLTYQRNILLMPCRHLTICSGCYDNLPSPKKCPMCRTLVKECLPIHVSPSLSAQSNQINDVACNVCLTSQRNVLLMPCRDLTICMGCYNNLPSPKKCPMCMTLVKECLSIYVT